MKFSGVTLKLYAQIPCILKYFYQSGMLQLQEAFRWTKEPLTHGPWIIEAPLSLCDSEF